MAKILDLVLIVLLLKSDGGFRPIGLFPTIIRPWMRSRIFIAKEWEASPANSAIFGGPCKGAQAAAYQTALVAEMANLDEDAFVASMLDLVKAFETVPHDVLVKAAHEKTYPLPLLRLCLAAYRLSRAIGVDGIFSRKVRATRGIRAGAGFAALELRLLLLDLIVILQKRWSPELLIKLYVDDLTLALRANPAELIR